MAETDLNSASFWRETGADLVVLGNPRRQADLAAVGKLAASVAEIAGHVVIETSGSSTKPKFVCLSRTALLNSARAVNAHLGADKSDRWLCALPTFHVGGLGIFARAFAGDSEVAEFDSNWDAGAFAKFAESMSATLTSLVPTQLADLVAAKVAAPPSLRAVVVGGGHLDSALASQALQLGWPVLKSYGMTEAASQIATQGLGSADDALRILPHWQVRCEADGGLAIRGDSLLTAYLSIEADDGAPTLEKPFDEGGWFTTRDRVSIDGNSLRFEGRVDRVVKILGELVDVDGVEAAFLARLLPQQRSAVVIEPVEDARRGCRLVAIVEERIDAVEIDGLIAAFNENAVALERVDKRVRVGRFPRTSLGKVRRSELRSVARLR